MICPKCKSVNTYFDGIDNACRTCGSRWGRNGYQPPPQSVIENKSKEQILRKTKREKRACRNCGRVAEIVSDGICRRCYYYVWKDKFVIGTPEYDAALAEAKIKYNDPSYRRKSDRRPSKHLTKPISPENIKKAKTAVRALSIKHNGGDPEMSGVIATMQMEHERLLAKADKLAQAIELLQ